MKGNPVSGVNYLFRGVALLTQPGIRLFVIIPLIINIFIFITLISFSLNQFTSWIEQFMAWIPEWLDFLRWIIWPFVIILLLTIVTYSFSIIANFIASPFNGLLAEKVEEMLTGTEVPASESFMQAIKESPKALLKEWQKLSYYLPKAILAGLFSLIFIFIFPPIVSLVWFLLGAWMMSLQYCDYPMDNHKFSLKQVLETIKKKRLTSFSFGSAVMLGTMIPFINFIVMPAAVCGATIYWVEELKNDL